MLWNGELFEASESNYLRLKWSWLQELVKFAEDHIPIICAS